MQVSHDETSTSLLLRISDHDHVAWLDFDRRYAKIIRSWASAWGASQFDTDDVIQETLLVVHAKIAQFSRLGTGSFRAWMRAIAIRCWRETLRRSERQRQVLELSAANLSEAFTIFQNDLDRLIDDELLNLSMGRAKKRVEIQTWEAFRLTALEEHSATIVAERLNMPVGSVYVARCRVQKIVSEEFKRLQDES